MPIASFQKIYNRFFSSEKAFYAQVRRITGCTPIKGSIYISAFTHRSILQKKYSNNECLELIGDAVIGLVFAEYIHKKYPTKDEGFLTLMRAKLANRTFLNSIGQRLGLDHLLQYNKKGNIQKDDLYGNTFEALVGAIYLDAGYKKAQTFLLTQIIANMVDIDEVEQTNLDYKTQLYIQFQRDHTIEFSTIEERKINHRNYYIVQLKVDENIVSTGEGYSKKIAEQHAARLGLEAMAT